MNGTTGITTTVEARISIGGANNHQNYGNESNILASSTNNFSDKNLNKPNLQHTANFPAKPHINGDLVMPVQDYGDLNSQ